MRHTYFEVENFKGIASARIDLTAHPTSRVYTLVGLNESGKTTVLQALNFLYRPETLDPLNLPGYSISDVHELIPISRRSNFNGKIRVKVGYAPDAEDSESLRQHLKSKFGFRLTCDLEPFYIVQTYTFKDSKLDPKQPKTSWGIKIAGKKKHANKSKERELQHPVDDEWTAAIQHLKGLLPSVLYFPNFLFEFPDKIYLENPPSDEEKHAFYRTILQDILDSLGEGIDLDTHVLARAKSDDKFDRSALESVLAKMEGNITRTIVKRWNEIFNRKMANKQIAVSYGKDEPDSWYLQLNLKDGDEQYAISERSLGFRWFFAFLLLTQYRGFRGGAPRNVLFLFDEPASNLHPSAQQQLLASFGHFPESCAIVYTTHSHHMINPSWLEGTFVVKNEGLMYDAEGEDDYSARKTLITLERYRQFAANHPNQTSYFQPVLDVLDYRPGELENIPDVIMVEGKTDFYTLKYLHERILKGRRKCHLMPGCGSGSLDGAIRLYLAWGRNFVVLLDADGEGASQKARYREVFGDLVEGRVFTLSDVCPEWAGRSLEGLLSEDDRRRIQSSCYPDTAEFSKTHFHRAVQELYLKDKVTPISDESKGNTQRLLEFLCKKLKPGNAV